MQYKLTCYVLFLKLCCVTCTTRRAKIVATCYQTALKDDATDCQPRRGKQSGKLRNCEHSIPPGIAPSELFGPYYCVTLPTCYLEISSVQVNHHGRNSRAVLNFC